VQDLFFTTTLPGLPKVEVLNGSGEVGAAQTVADALKLQGYEVISTGNADSFKYPSSRIVTHKKDLKGADALAKIVNTVDVKFAESQSAAADVTVIVGKDCALLANQGG
ncbi:MAG TPA: LytR C-terminal domain-containing protein, partial [Armatimonadota bacterium]